MHDLAGAPGVASDSSPDPRALARAIEADAAGYASEEQLTLLARSPVEWQRGLRRLLRETEAHLASVRNLTGPERDQVVADFEQDYSLTMAALARLVGEEPAPLRANTSRAPAEPPRRLDGAGEMRLQASWSDGSIVAWGAGPEVAPAGHDDLLALLKQAGAPSGGWRPHALVAVPPTDKASAQAIALADALGWLVSIGAGQRPDGIGASLAWMGRVAAWGVELVAQGHVVPTLKAGRSGRRRKVQPDPDSVRVSVRWVPALASQKRLDSMAASMPPTVSALDQAAARTVTLSLLEATVHIIVTDAAHRLDLPAALPVVRTQADVAESVVTGLDGSSFMAPTRLVSSVSDRLSRWARPVVGAPDDRLVVQLDPPDRSGGWLLSVLGPNQSGRLVPLEVALVDGRSKAHLAAQVQRLERLMPLLNRPGGRRRGEVILSQDEAFDLMAITGPALTSAGFDVRAPALSRRKPRPSLRLTADPVDASVVGAHQLANVHWSAMFDDVELSADDIRRLAAEARPLVHSRGRWVELDHVDLTEAAAALAERAGSRRLTGAEVLRHAIGLEQSSLSGTTSVVGEGWAADLLARTAEVSADRVDRLEHFVGELRSYQLEALAWLDFIDSAGLGGCLALDMGLGKTPTLLAHVSRNVAKGPTLVVAPTAVVGNWAAEARRFTPTLRVVVHHGASRAASDDLVDELAGADLVVTSYGTAVRDIGGLSKCAWARLVLDEAQTIKNPTSDVARQLRLVPAPSRVALTGTPIENGLGDLWAILDFTNPGLVGPRSAFVTQLSARNGAGSAAGEKALRALNGVLVFRRTKAEPEVAAELPDKIDELDHCTMTTEQIGLYQAVLDRLVSGSADERRQGDILAAITALKQICNHPVAYGDDGGPLEGRSGKLARLEEIVDAVFAAGEKVLVFTHFAEWGKRLATHLSARTGLPVGCYHGGLARGARDRLVDEFQARKGPAALVLSLKAGGTGLNLTAASHVVLYDRWWNPAVEDQARDRAWRLGQERTVISHRLVCPGTVDEKVEDVVAGKRHVADLVLPKSSSLADLSADQLRHALGLHPDSLLATDDAVDDETVGS